MSEQNTMLGRGYERPPMKAAARRALEMALKDREQSYEFLTQRHEQSVSDLRKTEERLNAMWHEMIDLRATLGLPLTETPPGPRPLGDPGEAPQPPQ